MLNSVSHRTPWWGHSGVLCVLAAAKGTKGARIAKLNEEIKAAYDAGCIRFDGAIKGFGGCPMAADDLTGNLPTEKLLSFFNQQKTPLNINPIQFEYAYNQALNIFI